MTERLLIIGSGALACLFAARISRSGTSVTMTDTWAEGVEAIRINGVRLVEETQTTTWKVKALNKPEQNVFFSTALILTKAYQTTEAVVFARGFLGKDGTLLTLQNGLTARSKITQILGEALVLSGITTCAAQMINPGVVKFNGGNFVRIGIHPNVENYQEIFTSAGFDVSIEPNIGAMIWEKAVLNAAINPLGAILGLTNGELKNDPDAFDLMKSLLAEGCIIARSAGFEIREDYISKILVTILNETAANQCSMLQDIQNGRQTEIDDINGALVEIAARNHIPTPVQEMVIRLVKATERKGNK